MEKPSADPTFSEGVADAELAATRPIRWTGFAALLLGLLSIAAIPIPALLPVPIAALVLGLIALRPADREEGRPVGQRVALVGIALALGFGGWSVAGRLMRESHLETTATAYAMTWLEVVGRGELELAYELTQPADARQIPSTPLKEFYAQRPDSEDDPWRQFRQTEAIYELSRAGTEPQWKPVGETRFERTFGSDRVRVTLRDQTDAMESDVVLVLLREVDPGSGVAEWRVEDFQLQPREA